MIGWAGAGRSESKRLSSMSSSSSPSATVGRLSGRVPPSPPTDGRPRIELSPLGCHMLSLAPATPLLLTRSFTPRTAAAASKYTLSVASPAASRLRCGMRRRGQPWTWVLVGEGVVIEMSNHWTRSWQLSHLDHLYLDHIYSHLYRQMQFAQVANVSNREK